MRYVLALTGGGVLPRPAHVIEERRLSCAPRHAERGILYDQRALKNLSHQWTKHQTWDVVMNAQSCFFTIGSFPLGERWVFTLPGDYGVPVTVSSLPLAAQEFVATPA